MRLSQSQNSEKYVYQSTWETRTHHGESVILYTSCPTRIHHGECAYLMANTHTSRGTRILYGKHAHIMGNVYISLGKADDKQMCVELNKAVLWINRHICYTKYTARGCEEIRDSFNYVKIAFVWLIVYKYVSGQIKPYHITCLL